MKFIRKTLKGEGIIGQVLYGVADILPFPNLLNVYRSVAKDKPYLSKVEVIREVVFRIDVIRFLVGATLAYLIVTGKITIETAKDILTLF